MWDVFMDQFEVLATKAPVMLVAGNHERDFPDSGDRYNTAIDSGMPLRLRSSALDLCAMQPYQLVFDEVWRIFSCVVEKTLQQSH